MDKKLKISDYLLIGSMLFGLFFGAGNLIFPVHMGQEAGAAIFQANLGFLVTGIGLPFLGIIAVGLSQSSGLFDLASRINRKYAYIFTTLLYLVIGPFFALPRLATTSFEVGLSPFLSAGAQKPVLALFSLLFFSVYRVYLLFLLFVRNVCKQISHRLFPCNLRFYTVFSTYLIFILFDVL